MPIEFDAKASEFKVYAKNSFYHKEKNSFYHKFREYVVYNMHKQILFLKM